MVNVEMAPKTPNGITKERVKNPFGTTTRVHVRKPGKRRHVVLALLSIVHLHAAY